MAAYYDVCIYGLAYYTADAGTAYTETSYYIRDYVRADYIKPFTLRKINRVWDQAPRIIDDDQEIVEIRNQPMWPRARAPPENNAQ